MKNLLFFFIISFLFGCSNSNESFPRYPINPESYEWINYYNVEGEVIDYQNEQDSITSLVVSRESRQSEEPLFLACLEEDPYASCQHDVATLSFPEGTSTETKSVLISIAIFGRDDLRVMPTTAGTAVNMGAKYNESRQDIETLDPENFTASYQANFIYKNEEVQAITLTTDSTEKFYMGTTFPPKRIILVKGVGIVEWDDYHGNTWFLVN